MSKAKFAYDRLYGTSLKETAVGDYIAELEQKNGELLKFVEDICHNDININDLKMDWVQKEAWNLLNKYKEN